MTYKWIFIQKIEKVKTSFLAVKRIGERFEIKGTVHRKIGSGQPRATQQKSATGLK